MSATLFRTTLIAKHQNTALPASYKTFNNWTDPDTGSSRRDHTAGCRPSMPGILIDTMSSPSADDHATDKRRSGRVSKPTQFLGIEHPAGAKRKRGTASDEDRNNSDEDETSADDDEPDEEELREQRAHKSARKPASKKARTNGTIPIRGTTQAKRQRKKTPGGALLDAGEVSGLYAELFSGDKEVDEVVGEWLQRFEAHESSALAEIINLVLRSCGCE